MDVGRMGAGLLSRAEKVVKDVVAVKDAPQRDKDDSTRMEARAAAREADVTSRLEQAARAALSLLPGGGSSSSSSTKREPAAKRPTQSTTMTREERDAAIEAQRAVFGDAEATAAYFREKGVYVSPQTGVVYPVTVDADGNIRGERRNDAPLPGAPGISQPMTTMLTVNVDGSTIESQHYAGRNGSTKVDVRASVHRASDGGIRKTSSTFERTSPNGTYTTTVHAKHDAAGIHTTTTDKAVEKGVRSEERHEVQADASGRPRTERITRTQDSDGFNAGIATIGSGRLQQTDELTYDANGNVSAIKRHGYDEQDQNALNDRALMMASLNGRGGFFTFGRVDRMPEMKDGKLEKDGIVSGPGATWAHRDVPIFVEGLDPAQVTGGGKLVDADAVAASERLTRVKQMLDDSPKQLLESSKGIRVVNEKSDGGGLAWVGGSHNADRMVITGGDEHLDSTNLLWHEYAHVSDPGGLESEWQDAARKDRSTAQQVIDSIPDGATVRGVRGDLLRDKEGHLGVTGYGSGESDVNRTEDFAESVMLFLLSRRDGGIVTVTNPDGSTRKITFEEMYPERAKLIKQVHGDFAGWKPGAAQPHTSEMEGFS